MDKKKITIIKDNIFFVVSSDEINRMYVILGDQEIHNNKARIIAEEFLDEMIKRKLTTLGEESAGGLIFFD